MESIIARYSELLRQLLTSPQLVFDENLRRALSTDGGVYRVLEKGTNWQWSLYVGTSTNLRRRVYEMHFKGNSRASILRKKLIRDGPCADESEVTRYLGERAAVQPLAMEDPEKALFEHFAVAVLRPKYND